MVENLRGRGRGEAEEIELTSGLDSRDWLTGSLHNSNGTGKFLRCGT